MRTLTLAEIAARIGATVEGDAACAVSGVAGLSDAGPGDVSFLANLKYAGLVAATRAAAVIVRRDWNGPAACALLRVENPDEAFAFAAALFGPAEIVLPRGIDPRAAVSERARIGANVAIAPFCVIEDGAVIGDGTTLYPGCYVGHDARIGADCRLYSNVSVRERCLLGNRVIVHCGAVIGSDGFGYARTPEGYKKIPQVGIVELADDVEVGANTTIDRARFGRTYIAQGTKLDNLIQVAHNVTIGAHTVMAAQSGISGSTKIGSHVQVGGQVGFAGHVEVGDYVAIGAQSGVSKSVPPKSYVFGSPAIPMDRAKRVHAYLMHLPELKKHVDELEKRLESLERNAGGAGGTTG